jgi:hypothetical protein
MAISPGRTARSTGCPDPTIIHLGLRRVRRVCSSATHGTDATTGAPATSGWRVYVFWTSIQPTIRPSRSSAGYRYRVAASRRVDAHLACSAGPVFVTCSPRTSSNVESLSCRCCLPRHPLLGPERVPATLMRSDAPSGIVSLHYASSTTG